MTNAKNATNRKYFNDYNIYMNCKYCRKPIKSINHATVYDTNSNTFIDVKDWIGRQYHKACYKKREKLRELYMWYNDVYKN